MITKLFIHRVAILGSGVMGTQIATHFANAGIQVLLYDLKAKDNKNPNAIIEKSLANLSKIHPNPLASISTAMYIQPANYDDDLKLLSDCQMIIEAIAENLEWKATLFNKIAEFVDTHAVIASNTSGLSIEDLSNNFPKALQSNFCGIHFFNPPRYMPLIELIPHSKTDHEILSRLETFLVTRLGKTVVRAKDKPNFLANRIGVFSMMAILNYSEYFKIPFEVVDQLTGKNLGRAKSATFRTADIVGLDTLVHVVKTMESKCKDGFESSYKIPRWLEELIKTGHLGQKSGAGIYLKDRDGLKVIDPLKGEYHLAIQKADPEVLAILNERNWQTRLQKLHDSSHAEAQFLWAIFRDVFHYCAHLLGEISDSPRDMDIAMRAGFGWKEGPFEIWQQANWLQVANWIQEDISSGITISKDKLPQWVFELKEGIYVDGEHFDYKAHKLVPLDLLPVYQRQIFPLLILNETSPVKTHVLYENPGVRLWHTGDNIGVLSFKSKMCAVGMDVLSGISEALTIAENECNAMVIWQEQEIFSVGANLEEFGFAIMKGGSAAVKEIIKAGHKIIANQLRYSKIPVVAGVRGYAFGGGCEILLQCSIVVAALESYIGLVESGVGLLPGWGGSTEMALRASEATDPWLDLSKRYHNLAMAKVSNSAIEAKEMGFLRESDIIVMNSREVLFVAKELAKFMALKGYTPPIKVPLKVMGKQGIANIEGFLVNMREGQQISEHDLFIAKSLAWVMCGGSVDKGMLVSREWLLSLEEAKFTELALSAKTGERIKYMLTNGKPLRN